MKHILPVLFSAALAACATPATAAQPAPNAHLRYRLALELLLKHLTWHAPGLPPKSDGPRVKQKQRRLLRRERPDHHSWRWHDAHPGEPWMLDRLSRPKAAQLDRARKAVAQASKLKKDVVVPVYWRLKDPAHPDVARTIRTLEAISAGRDPAARQLKSKALRWIADLRRNNTVLTLDVPGGYQRGRTAHAVVDVRNAEQVTFKLYGVRDPRDLVAVCSRIGEDFIYRDYGLRFGGAGDVPQFLALEEMKRVWRPVELRRPPRPTFRRQDLVHEWRANVRDLKAVKGARGMGHGGDWLGSDDYFDDGCDWHDDRLRKSYRPEPGRVNAWRCDRIVEVPARAVARPGAYVLVAEANGQVAHAPVLVDPLSLTLRRCQDGVFALVSSADGAEPVAGARMCGLGLVEGSVTDAAGAVFARIFAAGDRAVIVEKNGRYAVGGFGRVFEGVYTSLPELASRPGRLWYKRAERLVRAAAASVYADHYVAAAYTDRPTYRPGQTVRFKLIVRRLARVAKMKNARFRADEFDAPAALELPPENTRLRYGVVNPRGRVVAQGELTLNEFGTAAGKAALLDEAMTGVYALRIDLSGRPRVLPGVFAVKYYRRPSFALEVSGAPKTIKPGAELTLRINGRYYFGKPVGGGKAEARLVRPDLGGPLAAASVTLDRNGRAALGLAIPAHLPGGKLYLICSLTDDSGRTVTRSSPCEVEAADRPALAGLAALPQFLPADKPFTVETDARQVVARYVDERVQGRIPVKIETLLTFRRWGRDAKGVAVRLKEPGWYTLTAGAETRRLFVYGGTRPPARSPAGLKQRPQRPAGPASPGPRWVDLTCYGGETGDEEPYGQRGGNLLGDERDRVLALFDRHHARVGDKLRLLVYVPYDGARLLFTYEGWTVVDYAIVETGARVGCRYHVVELPIRKRHLPNVYLRGRIVSGTGLVGERELEPARELKAIERPEEYAGDDPKWCRIDVIDPAATPGREKLKVTVEADRAEHRPGDEVKAVVRVAGVDGKPRVAEVSLAAVDESVYAFGEDAVGRLAGAFDAPYPPRRYVPKAWRSARGDRWSQRMLLRRSMERLQQAAALQDMAKAAAAAPKLARFEMRRQWRPLMALGELPAGAVPMARLRTDFRETAAWLPQLRTGPNGVAQAAFKLPDSLTAYRLTAVGLTKATEMGSGRGRVRAALPVSVQVVLPRFAVEGDKLLAVALIHNSTKLVQTVDAVWTVTGVRADVPPAWRGKGFDGKTARLGTVNVLPGKTARVALWIHADRPGAATVTFRAGGAEQADAERRTLTIVPLGRERAVRLDGACVGRKQVKLPKGFVARDLAVTVSRSNIAQAVDGLHGLVHYPYGCVEQTMSRFLPAVTVRHAVRELDLSLPPEVEKKLPEVLGKGLARLYNFQHADGAWGWWKEDKSSDRMTVYVVYGLAVCRRTGTAVDAEVLKKGCDYLAARLANGKLTGELRGRAWLALSLADRTTPLLADHAKQADDLAPQARCALALACHHAGRADLAARLWKTLGDWEPGSSHGFALKLQAQMALGAPEKSWKATAAQLMARRRGRCWENTWATSAAIEALSGLLNRVKLAPAGPIRVTVAGKTLLNAKTPTDRQKLVHRIRVPAALLAGKEAVPITIQAGADEAVCFALTANGTQRLDQAGPVGKEIQMRRRYARLDGKEIGGPVGVGDIVAVHLTVTLAKPRQHVIVEDRRPAGLEFTGDRLFGAAVASAAHVEFRDDRVCSFFTDLPAGRHELTYYLRAETAGTSHVVPGRAYPMYDDDVVGETGASKLEVR